MTPPESALKKIFLKETILFVALIVPRKTLELCLLGFFPQIPNVLVDGLLLEEEDEGSGVGDRGSGIGKKIIISNKITEELQK